MKIMKTLTLMMAAVMMTALTANAQLGTLKDAKNKVNSATDKINVGKDKDKNENKEDDKSEKKDEDKFKDLSGYDLSLKGDEAYEAENYKDALEYYEAAEKKGNVDGMQTRRMNECKEEINKTPEQVATEQQQLNDIQAMLDKAADQKYYIEPKVDQGFTNSFHEQNVGKIVFSKTEIPKSTSSNASFSSSFDLGGNIYSRVYLSRSITNEAYSVGTYPHVAMFYYRYSVDGKEFAEEYAQDNVNIYGDEESNDTWTTFQLACSPSTAQVSEYPNQEMALFFRKVYSLPAGTHKIKVELVFDIPEDQLETSARSEQNCAKYTTKFGAERIVASGEFTLNVTEQGKITTGEKICPTFDYLNNHTNQVPNAFELVNNAKEDGETILKVVLLQNDWVYNRNVFGVIINREIKGIGIAQNNKTKLCYEMGFVFSQENISSGGTEYAATRFSRSGYFERAMQLFLKQCIE